MSVSNGRRSTIEVEKEADMADKEVDKVANIEVEKVADKEVDKVANIEVEKEADMVADKEVDKVVDMVAGHWCWLIGPKLFRLNLREAIQKNFFLHATMHFVANYV